MNYGFLYEDKSNIIPPATVNITKKTIDKISLVYKWQPRRELDITKEKNKQKRETLEEGVAFEPEKDAYSEWVALNPRIDRALKKAERMKNLLHHVLFRPWYWKETNKWEFYIETEFEPHFVKGDPIHPFCRRRRC